MANLHEADVATRTQLLFIQGAGEGTHDAWDDKLVAGLASELGTAVEVRYPRMPDEDDPSHAAWSAAILDELAKLRSEAIVVGHSFGGTVLLDALAERPPTQTLRAIVLIAAPFFGEGGWRSDGWTPPADPGATLPPGVPVFLFHGLADDTVPPAHSELLAQRLPQAHLTLLPHRDHQLNDDMREVSAAIRPLLGS